MKNLFLAILLVLSTPLAHAELLNAPFIPEVDKRFDGLESKQTKKYKWDAVRQGPTTLGAVDGTIFATGLPAGLQGTLPGNAVVTRAFLEIQTPLSSATASLTIKCGAVALSGAIVPGAAAAGTFFEMTSTGPAADFVNVGVNPCNVTVTDGVAALTAGDINIYIEYVNIN